MVTFTALRTLEDKYNFLLTENPQKSSILATPPNNTQRAVRTFTSKVSNAGENKVPAMHRARRKSLRFFLLIIQLKSKSPSARARKFPSTIRIDLLSSDHNSATDSLARGRAWNRSSLLERANETIGGNKSGKLVAPMDRGRSSKGRHREQGG